MSVFRSIVFSAALSGLVVGAAVTGLQHFGTVPLILKGEVYEDEAKAAEAKTTENTLIENKTIDAVTPPASASVAAEHGHEAEAWEPHEGLERNAYTAAANILTAIGFALLLGGLFVLRGRPVTAREGLFWGLAGFTVFTLAPGLGLPPELPGIPAAPVEQRQMWWVATALATSLGLYLLVFQRALWASALAIVLIVAPHVIGAPQLAEMHTNVPEALSRQFVAAVTVTSLIFWALLGPLTAVIQRRFAEV